MAKEKNEKKEKKEKLVKEKKVKKSGKVKKEKNDKKVKKESLLKGISKELKLVKWPTLKEIVKYTIATVVLCVILVLFFELLTFIAANIKEWVS